MLRDGNASGVCRASCAGSSRNSWFRKLEKASDREIYAPPPQNRRSTSQVRNWGWCVFTVFLGSNNSHTTPPKIPLDEEGLLWGWCVVGGLLKAVAFCSIFFWEGGVRERILGNFGGPDFTDPHPRTYPSRVRWCTKGEGRIKFLPLGGFEICTPLA